MEIAMGNKISWRGKNVFITGCTGFLGAKISPMIGD
jgi:nucleoside-diphosphate-sugar epimerase